MNQMPPFANLGLELKQLRERSSESLAEVSGAVEIEIETLEHIEAGHTRPSEDILLLLINHLDLQDQEAMRLWQLAGYEEPAADDEGFTKSTNRSNAMVVVLAMDVRTMYSDSANVTVNDAGVVLQFNQAGPHAKDMPVARLGMSHAQAEKLVHTLQTTMLKHKYLHHPKGLPEPRTDS